MDHSEQENQAQDNISQETDFSEIFSLLTDITSSQEDNKETSLLNSLRPYLSEKRRKKIDQCEKVMMMVNAFKLFNTLNETEDNNEE